MPELDGAAIRARLADARLYLCTPLRPDLAEFVDAALAGGVDIVQLRDKSLEAREELAALATLAGITLAAGPAGLSPSISMIALAAFPAMILGGLDSPAGAVLGGLIIGLAEALTRGYQDQLFSWAGSNVSVIVPYLLMILILLIRPYGLLGTKEVRRI